MDQKSNYNHLDEFIQMIIQMYGIEYVISNYVALRNQYYQMKAV